MAIYTSYFANYRKFPEGAQVIGITQYPPRGVENCGTLAPSAVLLRQYKNKQITEDEFAIRYERELNERFKNNKEELRDYLRSKGEAQDIILCCYEKTGDFCHRYILAKWLDLNIKEL